VLLSGFTLSTEGGDMDLDRSNSKDEILGLSIISQEIVKPLENRAIDRLWILFIGSDL
jgi:hypothetical protein